MNMMIMMIIKFYLTAFDEVDAVVLNVESNKVTTKNALNNDQSDDDDGLSGM